MPRPIRASISTAALRHNLAAVRHATRRADGSGPRVWAVAKAGAYGHGMAAARAGFESADGMALLDFDDAVALREAGWRAPILMLEGAFDRADVTAARAHDLTLAVHRPQQIDWLRDVPGAPIGVHLKIDTGMHRLGVEPVQVRAAHAALSQARAGVRAITLATHFARADEPDGARRQLERFEAATAGLPGERSLANSAAVFAVPQAHADWVRPGIALYGASPFAARSAASLGLRAAMTLRSELISVRTVGAGEQVGYGGTFAAAAPTRIGVVACGYADGYPRHAPTGTPVWVDGVRTRLVGRVSMDMLAVDLDPVPHAACGSPVELWGQALPIDEVARAAGTIGYELMCALAPRVPVALD